MKERMYWLTLSRPAEVGPDTKHQFVNSETRDYLIPFNVRVKVPEGVITRLRDAVIGNVSSNPDKTDGELVISDRRRFAFEAELVEDDEEAKRGPGRPRQAA